jgi:hypothetical protein
MNKSLAVWIISVGFALVSLVAISITWSAESYTSVIVLPRQMSGLAPHELVALIRRKGMLAIIFPPLR